MAYVVSFVEYAPAARFDGIPYEHALIEEAPDLETPVWLQIDDQLLDPIDLDPAVPALRNITTNNATLAEGWYRIVFTDADGNRSISAARFYNNAQPVSDAVPTTAEIRSETDVLFAEFGYPAPAVGAVDRLQFILDESVAELHYLLSLKSVTLDFSAISNPALAVLVRRALRSLVEFNAVAKQQGNVETAADFDMIQSVSVGAISESRRSISALANVLHPWPALNKLLLGIVALAQGGVLEGVDPNVPVFQSVENRPDIQQPGADIMYAQRWCNSIFGELRPLGVYRPGWDL